MEKANVSVYCLQFGVQTMDNKGEDAGKICVTGKEKHIFSNTRIERLFLKIICYIILLYTSDNCHFEAQVSERVRNAISKYRI